MRALPRSRRWALGRSSRPLAANPLILGKHPVFRCPSQPRRCFPGGIHPRFPRGLWSGGGGAEHPRPPAAAPRLPGPPSSRTRSCCGPGRAALPLLVWHSPGTGDTLPVAPGDAREMLREIPGRYRGDARGDARGSPCGTQGWRLRIPGFFPHAGLSGKGGAPPCPKSTQIPRNSAGTRQNRFAFS